MIFAILTLLAALAVASVSELFSIIGIMAIYAGAQYHSALIMGIVLGAAKLVTTSWLYRNWYVASWHLKLPLIYFTVTLMVVSSIGVYGFLTKSHLEQNAATIDNSAKIERFDQQIAREKSVIADNEKVILQLDTAINSFLGKDNTDRALSVRRAQAPQRKQLRADIDAAQKRIDEYSDAKLKLTSEVRALQLDVGPIKYIADLFYSKGSSDAEKIEGAVSIFTLLIVSTLDPLAVVLLIAANHTLLRLQNEKKKGESQEQAAIIETTEIQEKDHTETDSKRESAADLEDYSRAGDKETYVETPAKATENTTVDEQTHVEAISITELITEAPTDAPTETPSEAPTDAPIIKDQVATTPWAQQSEILAELIGHRPHFVPQKINENQTYTTQIPQASVKNSTTASDDTIQTAIEKAAEEIHTQGPEEIKDLDRSIRSPISQDATLASEPSNKYPKALSWIKEFKGS